MSSLSMRELLEAGVHFGHQTNRWNPKMDTYIFGARNGIYIIDLQQTVPLAEKAFGFLTHVCTQGRNVLFVGTKKQAQESVAENAQRAGQFYVNNRWLGGTLTNYRTIRQSLDRLRAIETMAEDGTFEKLTKKEVLTLTRERLKLEKNLGGVKDMAHLPGAMFVIDVKKEHIAISEARKLGIPVVAVVDTNCDPDLVDFVIPGNDDAIRSIRIFLAKAADACLAGSQAYEASFQADKAAAKDDKGQGQGPGTDANTTEPGSVGGPKVEIVRAPGAESQQVQA